MSYRPKVKGDAQGTVTDLPLDAETVKGVDVVAQLQNKSNVGHTHSSNDITQGYLNVHPENAPTLIPFMNNDISFLLKRGGSVVVKYDNVVQTINTDSMFDGSPSYWAMNPKNITTIVIEITLHKTFTWGNTVYVDFGAAGWRAKSIKLEVMNSKYPNDVWTQKGNTTTNASGHYSIGVSHTPVGGSNAGAGFNKIRYTFSTWNTATIFRIAQIGIYNYSSGSLRETSMSRGIDDYIFRNITPNANNTYKLGDSTHKWSEIHGALKGTADNASKLDNQEASYYLNYNNLTNKPTIPSAVTEATVSEWGFTKNVGTVTKVNNTSPDANGNVTITIPTVDYPVTDVKVNNTSVVSSKVASISAVTKLGTRTGDITIANLKTDLGLGSAAYTDSTAYAASSHTHSSLKNGNYTASLPTLTANATLALTSDIPSAVTESTVSGWGFTKNVGTVTKVNDTSPNTNGNVSLNFLKSGDYKASIPYLTSNATIALTSDIPVTKYTQSTVNLYTLADGRYINSTENDITMYYHPLHICNKKWKPGDILYIKLHRFYLLTQGSDSLCIVFGAANDTEDFAWCNSAMELDTIPQVHESMKEFGSESTPVYLSRDTNYGPFRFKKCKLYGGGTGIVKLNGYDALGKSYSAIYAPETAGTSGQFLKSKGSGAPIWVDLATVATSGSYNDLTDTPAIPTETTVTNWGFTKNVGTVTSVRVQAGTGLSSSTSTAQTSTLNTTISIASGYKLLTTSEYNTLNAKQDKISVGTNGQLLSSNGSSLVWTDDNRSLLHHDLGVIIENTTTDKGWGMFNSTVNGFLLKSVRFNAQSPSWGVGDFGAGIVFGGGDTKGVISVSYGTPKIKIAGGNGTDPTNVPKWWIGLTGTSKTSYDLDELKAKPSRVTGSWSVTTTNPGPMVDIILAHPDIKIYYKTYTSSTRKTDIANVIFNASYSDRQGIYTLTLRYINGSGSLTTIGAGKIYYEYFE